MTAAAWRQGEGQGRGGGWWGPLPSTVHHCSFRGVVWCRHIAGHTCHVGGHHLYSHHELETLTTNFKIKITSIKNKDAWPLTFLPPYLAWYLCWHTPMISPSSGPRLCMSWYHVTTHGIFYPKQRTFVHNENFHQQQVIHKDIEELYKVDTRYLHRIMHSIFKIEFNNMNTNSQCSFCRKRNILSSLYLVSNQHPS